MKSPKAPVPGHEFVYLASQSPRRRQLLSQIGVRHELLLAGPDEDAEALEAELRGESPLDYVARVTRAKLLAARRRRVARGLPEAPVLCADTTVALGRRILGKPADADEARRTLNLLAGRTHRVITAVAVAWGRRTEVAVQVSKVRFAPIAAGRSTPTWPAANPSARPAPTRSRAAPRPGSRTSRAATPLSWVCLCTRPPSC